MFIEKIYNFFGGLKMSERLSAMWLIQLFIGIFLIAAALLFLTGTTGGSDLAKGMGKMFGNKTWGTIVAILQLISGILLLAGLFISAQPRLMFLATLIIFILWAINILSIYFFGGHFLKPNFMAWVRDLSLQLVVLSGLWGVMMGSKE